MSTYSGEAIRENVTTRSIVRSVNITQPDEVSNSAEGGSQGSQFIAALRDFIADLADEGRFDGDGDPDYVDAVYDFVYDYENQHLVEAWADLIAWDSRWSEQDDGSALGEIRVTMRNMGNAIAGWLLNYVREEDEDEDSDDEEEWEEPDDEPALVPIIPGLSIFA